MSDAGDAITRRAVMAGTGLAAAAVAVGSAEAVTPRSAPPATPVGAMDLFRVADAPTSPTGLAISPDGRVFVFMPRFDDKTLYSIGEVAPDGRVSPWPNAAINRPDPQRSQDTLFYVPNGVFDAKGRMWVLDAGLTASSGVPVPGAPKLVCFDLASGTAVATILLGPAVVATSSLNDLRVDIGAGRRDAAYVTDQGQDGHGAIIAVDVASGRVVRRLARHSSTASVKGTVKIVEGRQVMRRGANGQTSPVQGGANGIALSVDGTRLYWAPLMGRHLYAAPTADLLAVDQGDAAVAGMVEDLGEKGLTGGLEVDAHGRVFLSLQEMNAVGRRDPDGTVSVIASDPRLIWADSFVIREGWLYVSSSQINRRPEYNGGRDLQQKPYAIFRMRLA